MKKFLSLLGSLLLSTAVFAGSEAYEATCPQEFVNTENTFWALVVDDGSKRTVVEKIDIKCAVLKPALTIDDFKKISMIMEAFILYPDVVIPWTSYENEGTFIVRGRVNNSTKKIEFIKVMYMATNGNMTVSTIVVGVNLD